MTYIGSLELEDVNILQINFSGTVFHVLGFATSTILAAFINPKPKAEFTQNPAPFCIQPTEYDHDVNYQLNIISMPLVSKVHQS